MKSRTEILKEFYKKGMNGKKSSLVKEAARVAECSEKTVMVRYMMNSKWLKICHISSYTFKAVAMEGDMN